MMCIDGKLTVAVGSVLLALGVEAAVLEPETPPAKIFADACRARPVTDRAAR
ncbi:MAG: hypothetical protein PUJ80_12055 [Verrucomicrobiota bacterium]|nr:hypothetical protein [Verrucomicrobiota bacterium]